MLQEESRSSKQDTLKSNKRKIVLTLAPTPIGNLEDISFRVIRAFESAELFFCEDTRVTKKLLNLLSEKHDITFKCDDFRSLHHHNQDKVLKELTPEFFESKNIVYVSDAGMPCISDPGAKLVEYCIDHSLEYDVIPGANAVLTAYAMSGFDSAEFTFFAFLAHKGAERKDKLDMVMNNQNISILYESPHRLAKLLEEIKNIDENREIFLVKELTKMHQNYYKDTALNIFEQFKNENIKGEWVVVIDKGQNSSGKAITVEDINDLKLPPKQKAKLLSKLTGKSTKEIYDSLIN